MTNAHSKIQNKMQFNGRVMPLEDIIRIEVADEVTMRLPLSIYEALQETIEFYIGSLADKYKANLDNKQPVLCELELGGDIWVDTKSQPTFVDNIVKYIFINVKNIFLAKDIHIKLCARGHRINVYGVRGDNGSLKVTMGCLTKKAYKEAMKYRHALELVCACCNKKGKLLTCGRCKWTKYCGEECQAQSHAEHKAFCKEVAAERHYIQEQKEIAQHEFEFPDHETCDCCECCKGCGCCECDTFELMMKN
jgi:hypothetical protein